MDDTTIRQAVIVAYQRLSAGVGRCGLRWVQAQGECLALGFDPLQRSRRRLPRRLMVNGCPVPLAWFAAPQPMRAQAWMRIEASPSSPMGSGTLAAVLRSRDSPDTLLGLTAGHVLNHGRFGDAVVVHPADAAQPVVSGQLYDWLPDVGVGLSVDLDAALVTLPANAIDLLADRLDWPRAARRDVPVFSPVTLLTRHHRIGGELQWPLTTLVQAGPQQYTMNNALCYQLDGSSVPGDSGAPLWDDEEQLIGVHLGAAPAGAAGNGVGTPIARVLDWAEADVVTRSSLGALALGTTVSTPAPVLPNLGDDDTVARTLWGEARNQGTTGMEAVAHVIFNRQADRRWRGKGGLAAICLQPAQFSCWNAKDPNRRLCLTVDNSDPAFVLAQAAVAQVRAARVADPSADPTHGATHYHAKGVLPFWAPAGEHTVTIGQHLFYRNVP
ncbi:cell wall hydrolase [Ideonella alba]|uniref:Cell wall hydrolase n=1 Tax=Ideonella alba TaxID=2824118 RepID=A0A940Y959_9BURK|nr:cell wall hydrolase [Ideonella alba]MBQ0931168.1 cell wall hydrolase [Ideonella alba]